MKDATLTQAINKRVTTSQPQTAAKESPLAAIPSPCEEKIRELAYRKWQVAGCPENDGIDFWLQAERELALLTC
jgi:hypothetical protein